MATNSGRADDGSCEGTAAVARLWTREQAGGLGWGSEPGGGDLVRGWEAGEGRDRQAEKRKK
jgi:hypothetical protein